MDQSNTAPTGYSLQQRILVITNIKNMKESCNDQNGKVVHWRFAFLTSCAIRKGNRKGIGYLQIDTERTPFNLKAGVCYAEDEHVQTVAYQVNADTRISQS